MAQTFDLACLDCRRTLWIGAAATTPPPVLDLHTSPEAQGALAGFLTAHRGHRLCFDATQALVAGHLPLTRAVQHQPA